ncbi:hypothetical protein D7J45_24345, partial [Salmonella enterica]|nr:hypothetical protein [Salmonella enterica]
LIILSGQLQTIAAIFTILFQKLLMIGHYLSQKKMTASFIVIIKIEYNLRILRVIYYLSKIKIAQYIDDYYACTIINIMTFKFQLKHSRKK